MRGKSNFRAGCIEQNHFGYMWTDQILGIETWAEKKM